MIKTNKHEMTATSNNLLRWAEEELNRFDHLEIRKNVNYYGFKVPLLVKNTKKGTRYFFHVDDKNMDLGHLFELYDIRAYNKSKSVSPCKYFGLTKGYVGDDVKAVAKDYDIPIIQTKTRFREIIKKSL